MKRVLLTITIFLCVVNCFSQEIIPSYPEVLRCFFSRYSGNTDSENFLNFAKKKDGWFVQNINRVKKDTILDEKLFWSLKEKRYLDIGAESTSTENEEETEKNIKYYLEGNGAYFWNDYERCRYHGYNGWEDDILETFDSQVQLPDTLLESLGRAYSSISNTYLWYQQGGRMDGKDTMQITLNRLQAPSEGRINKVISLITKSIETYDRLLKQNPSYVVLIGNVYLKRFNECMHGYMQMSLAMQYKKAMLFINKAILDEHYIKQAKNYLNSCDKNGILFTYGDNDTYQLWYVQEKENFRKDVTVINISMLGLPIYVDMLRKNKAVNFAASSLFYGSAGSDITYFREDTAKNKKDSLSLQDFLKNVYSHKEKEESFNLLGEPQVYSTYSVKKINFAVNNNAFDKISHVKTTVNSISFELKQYLYISDLMIFDIINENINTRPIYFTVSNPDYFADNLLQQGVVFRLFPINNTIRAAISKKEIKSLEKFTDSIYQPVVSFNVSGTKNISADGNNVFFQMYSRIAGFYKEEGDIIKTAFWLSKASNLLPEITSDNMPAAYQFIDLYSKADKQYTKKYMEIFAAYQYDKYIHPSAIKGYLSKDDCLYYLNAFHAYLEQEKIPSNEIDLLLSKLQP